MSRILRPVVVFGLTVIFGELSLIASPPPARSAKRGVIDTSKVIDLTYSFDASTIYWPTTKSFDWQKESWGISPGSYWYAAARIAMALYSLPR